VPEGHTLHRLARRQQKLFGGAVVTAGSPQGRFADGAALIDGSTLVRTEAYGKHLFHHYRSAAGGGVLLHVHLGLYGSFVDALGTPPPPVGALRLRLVGNGYWADLRGPTACELLTPPERLALLRRLGPDPLRRPADGAAAFARVARSRTVVAALLMDQSVVAGIGNVYRAELLFRHRIWPFLPGNRLPAPSWGAMWADLRVLMRAGVRTGRIVTIRPDDRPRKRGPLARDEAGYVYRRAGLPCRVCATEIRTEVLAGRNLFWCPNCQAPD
jgi:formamidopyrimidine-DNA glycosylase